MTSQLLEVEGVTVLLSGRRVLDSITFSLGAGEFAALIGPNGAGKTTLLRVILGLQRRDAGSVLLRGGERTAKTHSIGYVPQKVGLDPDTPMRARDLVALGLDGHRFGVPLRRAQRAAAVDEMLEAVDARAFANARVGELSGGEQQRVLIAHALISRPDLILLDEPLANLDLRSAQEVIALLHGIARDQDVGLLLSAHDINPLLPAIDRVVYLAGGRAATGTTAEVVQSDVLSALYGHQVDVLHVHGRIVVVVGTDQVLDHHDEAVR